MLVGYVQVCSTEQDPGYRLRALEQRGCEKIFTDRCSGRLPRRPQLGAALDMLRQGDALVVWKFAHLTRNLRRLIDLGIELEKRGCQLVSLTEAIDTTSPGGNVVFAVFGAMAEVESDLNRERLKESYRAAKAAGRRWGRPSPFHHPENVRVAKAMLADRSISRSEVARRCGVSRNALYRWFPGGDPEAFTGERHSRRRD